MLCYDPEVGNRNLEKDDAIVLSSRATETHEVFEKFHRHCSLAPTRCLIRITACCTALVGLWHIASIRCGAKVRTRSERSGHAESVGSGSI